LFRVHFKSENPMSQFFEDFSSLSSKLELRNSSAQPTPRRPHKTMRLLQSSLALLASNISIVVKAQCPNKCSRNGICNNLGVCECMPSFTGADCSIRTCPSGKAFSDVPYGQDKAHNSVPCSGRGVCKYGNCECDEGFSGVACERSEQ
jgi:hypothetical protein